MLHKSTKIIATTGTLFFLLSVGVFSVFLHVVTKQKAEFTEQTVENIRSEAHHDSLAALMETLEKTKDERESLTSRVLREEDVIDFLALIESLGDEQGVELTTASLTVESIDAVFETLVVNVGVEGSYTGVMQVLKIIEHLPYQTTISGFQITHGVEEGSLWESTYNVRVTKFKKNEI
jgi:Tfp pilus assembly protein PilO